MNRRAQLLLGVLALASAPGCTTNREPPERLERLAVTVRLPGGVPPPGPSDPPLPVPLTSIVELEFDVEAQNRDGTRATFFNGFARVDVSPGSVVEVVGGNSSGRNVFLQGGLAQGQLARVRGVRGDTRLWVEDIGYVPADPFKPPACSDGLDNDDDGIRDFPEDSGCAFANDDTETVGNFAAGVSGAVRYDLPRLGDVQGRGASTPYPLEGIEVKAEAPAELIVTRIANDGFNVTDLTDLAGFQHIFAFTFSRPGSLLPCDKITSLSGTAVEFFGFTELSFPSWEFEPWVYTEGAAPCSVPAPIVIDAANAENSVLLETVESALVEVRDVRVGAFFGPDFAIGNSFSANGSNCDFDGNGVIDFETPNSAEGSCANACGSSLECVEWTGFASRGNFRVIVGGSASIQANTSTIQGFDPPSMRAPATCINGAQDPGETGIDVGGPCGTGNKLINRIAGTLRNFSGGSLNWTIETRCIDDLNCQDSAGQRACEESMKPDPTPPAGYPPYPNCRPPRGTDDPNEATN